MAKRKNYEINCSNSDFTDDERSVKNLKTEDLKTDIIPKSPEYAPEYYTPHSPSYTPPPSPVRREEIKYESVDHLYKLSKTLNNKNLEAVANDCNQIYGHDFYKLGAFRQTPMYNPSIVLPQPPLPKLVVNNNMDCDIIEDTSDLSLEKTDEASNQRSSVIADSKFSKTVRPHTSIILNFFDIPQLCNICMAVNCIC